MWNESPDVYVLTELNPIGKLKWMREISYESTMSPLLSSAPLKKGLVQVFTGDGKGKTSAAAGSIIRAIASGLNVYAAVLMKGGNPEGEWSYLSRLPGVTIERFGSKNFCNPERVKPEDREQAKLALETAAKAMLSGKYDMVVVDEINVAAAWKLIDVQDVIKMIEAKPANVELILTGRYAAPEVIEKADLVTEMRKIKHPFDTGQPARKGIEY